MGYVDVRDTLAHPHKAHSLAYVRTHVRTTADNPVALRSNLGPLLLGLSAEADRVDKRTDDIRLKNPMIDLGKGGKITQSDDCE